MDNPLFKLSENKKQTLFSTLRGFAFFVFLYAYTKIFGTTLCPIKRFFGVSCFGCGMTSGFISVIQLDFCTAWECNVLSIPLFFCVLGYVILLVYDIVWRKDFLNKLEKQLAKKYMYVFYISVLILSIVLNNLN